MGMEELRPERNWWERASVVPYGIPKPIIRECLEVKKRFGVPLADLVIFAYKQYGSRVAKDLATKILSFEDFKDLMRYLMRQATMFDVESRKILVNELVRYMESVLHDNLLELLKNEPECVREVAVKVFQRLVESGIFVDANIIVEYSKKVCGLKHHEYKSFKAIERVVGDEIKP